MIKEAGATTAAATSWAGSSAGRVYSKLRQKLPLRRSSFTSQSHHNNNHRCSSRAPDCGTVGFTGCEMELTQLPYTIFTDLLSLLSPLDVVRIRCLSTRIQQILIRSDLCISLIRRHFPHALESRILLQYLVDHNDAELESTDWATVYSRLARRYHHLSTATVRTTVEIPMSKPSVWLRGITPWNRILTLNQRIATFHYWDPVWTFAPADGLLIYPLPAAPAAKGEEGLPITFVARDLFTDKEIEVPFHTKDKVIRRVRLSHNILIFEWAKSNRHFATAFDIYRAAGSNNGILPRLAVTTAADEMAPDYSWMIKHRSEWDVHPLGLPLTHDDRFFSAHNATHYVVYLWHPTSSIWTEDAPTESIAIWELGSSSDYLPSGDNSLAVDDGGPKLTHYIDNEEIDHWGVKQDRTPTLRGLQLDDCTWDKDTQSATGHVFFLQEEHRWASGPHSSYTTPRLHHVKSTAIPITGHGPRYFNECGNDSPSSASIFCWRDSYLTKDSSCSEGDEVAEIWPGRAPCWRHDDFPYLTVSEAYDVASGVRFTARHCFLLETLSVYMKPRLCIQQVVHPASNENYANDKEPLELYDDDEEEDNNIYSLSVTHNDDSITKDMGNEMDRTVSDGPQGREAQFEDGLWSRLMGAGFIVGDERWLVGQNQDDHKITVLYF